MVRDDRPSSTCFDLPPDYYQALPARIEAITAADVHAATRRTCVPKR